MKTGMRLVAAVTVALCALLANAQLVRADDAKEAQKGPAEVVQAYYRAIEAHHCSAFRYTIPNNHDDSPTVAGCQKDPYRVGNYFGEFQNCHKPISTQVVRLVGRKATVAYRACTMHSTMQLRLHASGWQILDDDDL